MGGDAEQPVAHQAQGVEQITSALNDLAHAEIIEKGGTNIRVTLPALIVVAPSVAPVRRIGRMAMTVLPPISPLGNTTVVVPG